VRRDLEWVDLLLDGRLLINSPDPELQPAALPVRDHRVQPR